MTKFLSYSVRLFDLMCHAMLGDFLSHLFRSFSAMQLYAMIQ